MNDDGSFNGDDNLHSYIILFFNAGDPITDGVVTLEGDISLANVTLSGSTPPISDFVD
jgi:hypothetical protein